MNMKKRKMPDPAALLDTPDKVADYLDAALDKSTDEELFLLRVEMAVRALRLMGKKT